MFCWSHGKRCGDWEKCKDNIPANSNCLNIWEEVITFKIINLADVEITINTSRKGDKMWTNVNAKIDAAAPEAKKFNEAQDLWEKGLNETLSAVEKPSTKTAEEIAELSDQEKQDYMKSFTDYGKKLQLAEAGYWILKGASPQEQLNKEAKDYYEKNKDKFTEGKEVDKTPPVITSPWKMWLLNWVFYYLVY